MVTVRVSPSYSYAPLSWGLVLVVQFHQYEVAGRGLPTPTEDHPRIYRMKLWATSEIRTKSKFC